MHARATIEIQKDENGMCIALDQPKILRQGCSRHPIYSSSQFNLEVLPKLLQLLVRQNGNWTLQLNSAIGKQRESTHGQAGHFPDIASLPARGRGKAVEKRRIADKLFLTGPTQSGCSADKRISLSLNSSRVPSGRDVELRAVHHFMQIAARIVNLHVL